MGGKSKKQTIGYKHYLGMHCVFCHGPIDGFVRVSSDERVAWTGTGTGGTINIAADDLYGGESREGGFSGPVDIAMGGPAQGKNAYLLSKIGPNIPAYRGVAALIFKDFYFGNNPYLKAISARGQRVFTGQDGAPMWNVSKAAIFPPVLNASSSSWRYQSFPKSDNINRSAPGFDDSSWAVGQAPFGNGNWTYPSPRPAQHGFGEVPATLVNANFKYWARTTLTLGQVPAALRFECFIDNDASLYVNGTLIGTVGGPNGDYYEFLVDGSHFISGDNTVAVVWSDRASGAPPTNWFWFDWRIIDLTTIDMNPAHIIRECLTNQDWGMGYDVGDIDATSFEAAANTLFGEGLGISLVWDKQAKIEDFINEIVRHIDAALYVSRETGKFVLKLIRADYDPNTLIVLDESNIERIAEPTRAAFGELVNSITVNFWNSFNGKADSITVQDPAGVQQQGTVINTTVQYPGFTNSRTGQIACSRDLRTLSNPFLSCTVYTGEIARHLEPGDVFKLTWGKWKLQEVVMRVTGFALSEGKGEQVRLTCVEDVFSTPLNAVLAPPGNEWTDPSQPPQPVGEQIAGEAPYYELIQVNGQTQTDTDLTVNPNMGYVIAAAGRPASAINAKMWTDAGGGFQTVDTFDFAPSAILTVDLDKTTTSAVIANMTDLDLIELGSHFQIGLEMLRVDSLDEETGVITFGRGVLDTVPHKHQAGAMLFFWDLFYGTDPTEYAAGETVDVRVTPISGAGQVAIGDAIETSVLLDQRAYRPYPPGNLTINGQSYVDTTYSGELTVAWAHRDRRQQTSGELADHFDGDIGPEEGTTYRVRTYIDNVLEDEQDDIVGTDVAVTPIAEGLVRIEVSSKRDEVYSMQAATHEFTYTASGEPRAIEDSDDYRYTEDGDIRITED